MGHQSGLVRGTGRALECYGFAVPALPSRAGLRLISTGTLLCALLSAVPARSDVSRHKIGAKRAPDGSGVPRHAWCAPKLETLPGDVCHYTPPDTVPRVLVIFLHGVIKWNSTWQWTQQRAAVRFAKAHHFSALMPPGRRGIGHSPEAGVVTWPVGQSGRTPAAANMTAGASQASVEQQMIGEWMAAKALLERRNGRRFEKTYVFGYSAGAYFAASLALRGRLNVDGYAVFAGGAAPKDLQKSLPARRPPIFVAYGRKDPAWRDPDGLAWALRKVGWRHRLDARMQMGHDMNDSQVKNAVKFLDAR